jgi:undecaprenyl-diphosphatase
MSDSLAVILLGIVEGLTEFLPVSSTGHLLIAEEWLHPAIAKTALFNTVIQCGALLAVLMVFKKRVVDLLCSLGQPSTQSYLLKLIVAFGITGAGGLFVKKVLHWELPKTLYPVAMATLIGGVVILVIESFVKKKTIWTEMTWMAAIAVGCAQLLAGVFPGTSRSGACILFALALGVRRPSATEFSFLLGIPTLFAASALEFLTAMKQGSSVTQADWGLIGLGSASAAISAFLVVHWLLRFVQTHTFNVFGWYRIALGALLLWK